MVHEISMTALKLKTWPG